TLRCERVRGCAGPRATFCSCDGETFTASAVCPGRSFVRRGACDGMVASGGPDAGTSGAGSSEVGTAVTGRPAAGVAVATARRDAGRPDAGVAVATRTPDAGVRWAQTGTEDGARTCRTHRDCRGTEVCAGPAGCGETWTCQRQRDVA